MGDWAAGRKGMPADVKEKDMDKDHEPEKKVDAVRGTASVGKVVEVKVLICRFW